MRKDRGGVERRVSKYAEARMRGLSVAEASAVVGVHRNTGYAYEQRLGVGIAPPRDRRTDPHPAPVPGRLPGVPPGPEIRWSDEAEDSVVPVADEPTGAGLPFGDVDEAIEKEVQQAAGVIPGAIPAKETGPEIVVARRIAAHPEGKVPHPTADEDYHGYRSASAIQISPYSGLPLPRRRRGRP